MKQTFHASLWQEGEWFVAQCLEIDIASQGVTKELALENLAQAMELYFEGPVPKPVPQIEQIEVEVGAS